MRKLLLFFAIGILFLSATRSNAEVTFTYNGGNLTITQTTAGEIASGDFSSQFSAALGSVTDLGQVTFSGAFQKSDLEKLTGQDPYQAVVKSAEKVDMANTTFNSYYDMDFKPWGSNLQEAVTSLNAPADYTVGEQNFGQENTNLATITYNSGIAGKPYNNNTSVKTVNIGPKTVAVADYAFMRAGVTTLNMDNATSLATIGNSAFLACPIEGTLTIGPAVKEIKDDAFHEVPIKTLIIPSTNTVIKSIGKNAFLQNGGGNLKDVYVYAQRIIQCDLDAFDLVNTDAQTQIESTAARTRLHYPPQLYDWYVGLYKQTINNGNLNEQKYLIASRNRATNGWQRFISSGILMDRKTTWRTFSDVVPLIVPSNDNVEIFLVHGYDVDNDAAILVKMDAGDYIPMSTGILVHYPNVGSGSVIYIDPAMYDTGIPIKDDEGNDIIVKEPIIDDYGNPTGQYNTYTLTEKAFISEAYYMDKYDHSMFPNHKYKDRYDNYLVALNVSSQAAPVPIDNVEIVNGKKTYRNYFFNRIKDLPTADGGKWIDKAEWEKWLTADHKALAWGFVRAKTGLYQVSQKAYLHFPVGENFPGKTSGARSAQSTPGTDILAKQTDFPLTFFNREEFDINNFTSPFDEDVEATSIAGVVEASKGDNCFYTLQGVKVASPEKNGIYIYNGKKYIVK